jgi:hypothetical protein
VSDRELRARLIPELRAHGYDVGRERVARLMLRRGFGSASAALCAGTDLVTERRPAW